MKVPIVLLLVLAAIAGYLFGTEQGRLQKDEAIKKIRRQTDDAADAVGELADEAAATTN